MKIKYEPKKDFKYKLKKLRKSLGLSRQELAEILNLSPRTVESYEQGRSYPKKNTINKLSRVFSVPVEELTNTSESIEKAVEDKEIEKINSFFDYAYICDYWDFINSVREFLKSVDAFLLNTKDQDKREAVLEALSTSLKIQNNLLNPNFIYSMPNTDEITLEDVIENKERLNSANIQEAVKINRLTDQVKLI